jgi:PAS domain S-box-containing protein/putative nucleotidyltransferase with HDIG domain
MASHLGEKRYRRLFETAPDGILILDAADGRIIDANPFILKLLGYRRSELTGRALWDIGMIGDREAAKAAFAELQRSGYIRFEDLDLQTRGGLRVPVEFVSNLFQIDGERVVQCNIRDISERKLLERRLQALQQSAHRSLQGTVSALAGLIESRDPYTSGHMARVADLAARIARRMGRPAEEVEAVRTAGELHDIGKNSLPNELLVQPAPLTPEQRRAVEQHVAVAVRVLRDVEFPWPVLEAIAQHHERLDGSGYPYGLVGPAIIMEARILAVADTIEAMLHARPYRPAFTQAAVDDALATGRGSAFDAAVVDAARGMLREAGTWAAAAKADPAAAMLRLVPKA